MKCKDYLLMMKKYSDGVLSGKKEPAMFAHIAVCRQCRNDFKIYYRIKTDFLDMQKELPINFISHYSGQYTGSKGDKIKSVPIYYLYAIVAAMLVFSFLSYTQFKNVRFEADRYRKDLRLAAGKIDMQNRQINLLMKKYGEITAAKVE
ncbi:MAG: hypothetical protein ACM3SM_01015 [Bacteroidota bacterium]